MSVNVTLTLTVAGLASDEQARAVHDALAAVLLDESLEHDVDLEYAPGPAGDFGVRGTSPYPIIISAFYRWHEPFEQRLRDAVGSQGTLSIDWGYPDEA